MAIHVIYFENRDGNLQLPPTDDTPTPPNYQRKEANSLAEVDVLQRRLQQESHERCQREADYNDQMFAAEREDIRSRLTTRLASSMTSQYEKEFIRGYLQLREEKRAEYRKRFACDTAYLEMRENDKPRNA